MTPAATATRCAGILRSGVKPRLFMDLRSNRGLDPKDAGRKPNLSVRRWRDGGLRLLIDGCGVVGGFGCRLMRLMRLMGLLLAL